MQQSEPRLAAVAVASPKYVSRWRTAAPAGSRQFRLEAALANPTFSALLVVLATLAVLPGFAFVAIAAWKGSLPVDFSYYLKAARDLQTGVDPYLYRLHVHGIDETRSGGYVYLPLLAWTLQPLTAIPAAAWPKLIVVGQLVSLAASLALCWLVLGIRRWQGRLASVVLAAGYYPVAQNFALGQINLLLLLLCALWLMGYTSRRLPSWPALGLAASVKLLQGPLVLAELVARRWGSAALALGVIAVASLIAGPRLAWEFFSVVLPGMSAITGVPSNLAPAGTLDRLIHPGTIYADGQVVDPLLRAGIMAVSAAVVGMTAWRGLRGGSDRLAVGSLFLAAMPLISTLDWPAHLVVLLPSLLFLFVRGLRTGERSLVAAALTAWLLTGPGESLVWSLAAQPGWYGQPGFRLAVELPAAGLWLLWFSSISAIRPERTVRLPTPGFNFAEHAALHPDHWWVAGRSEILSAALRRYLRPGARVLDVGCGGGLLSSALTREYEVDSVDISGPAVDLARSRGVRARVVGPLEVFPTGYDAAVAFDVLEHVHDDAELIQRLAASVSSSGVVAVAVPAFEFLWSPMDAAIGHHRRYRVGEVASLMRAAGLAVEHATYFNCVVFPFIALMRALGVGAGGGDVDLPPAPLNAVLRRLFTSERAFVPSRSAPFGVSLLVVGRKL